MRFKFAIAGLLLAGFVAPALADDEYYVVQDGPTKRCTIVKEKPSSSSSLKILGMTVFKAESDASGYMKSEKVCTTE